MSFLAPEDQPGYRLPGLLLYWGLLYMEVPLVDVSSLILSRTVL